jgi:hypothetical protein
MKKLVKLAILTTIVLLSYSKSWCQTNTTTPILSTGELIKNNDSTLVSFDDLRKANAKMIELKYEKEINKSLRSIIANDENIIKEYDNNVNNLKLQIIKETRKRKIVTIGGIAVSLALVIAIIAK